MKTTSVQDFAVDERLLAQLRTMPYDLDVNEDGQLVMTPRGWEGWTREEITEREIFPDDFNGWKIETNAQRQILLMPSPGFNHQAFEMRIVRWLMRLLPDGEPLAEIGVKTSDGTKEPDVVWMSRERFLGCRNQPSLSPAPELCVEVISPRNTRREINEKRLLYFEAGAQEVWICDEEGGLTFYTESETVAPRSRLCPEFPTRVDPFAA